jgi:hypothetical protein
MMAKALIVLLRALGRTTRLVASLGLLFLAVRFAWLTGGDVIDAWAADSEILGGKKTESKEKGPDALRSSVRKSVKDSTYRPDLEELSEAAKGALDSNEPAQDDEGRRATPRRILVDLGDERSEVFINTRAVGRVPYVGQITCAEGDAITIQVLPPSGAPIIRRVVCRGTTILAR